MGVKGLSTFLDRFRGKYSETHLVRNQCLVIDGSNLMYKIYFQESFRNAHLFGGDFVSYARRLREFFDKLRLAFITPIVIVDGALEKEKLKTVLKRFVQWLNTSLKVDITSIHAGKHQHSVWISVIFHEILFEKGILQFQTEWDADDTIALVAKHLQCPILSNDSDFHIYGDLKIIGLDSFRFKERFTPAERILLNVSVKRKIYAFRSVCLPAQRVWEGEFKITDVRSLTLATALLGNDYIEAGMFRRLLNKITGYDITLKTFERIDLVLRWIGSQDSFENALAEILNSVKEENRQNVRDIIFFVMKSYVGEGGEGKVLDKIKVALRIPVEAGAIEHSEDEEESAEEHVDEDLGPSEEIEQLTLDGEKGSSESEDEEEDIELPEYLNIEILAQEVQLPDWFLELYSRCIMPAYFIKMAYNKTVFLYPQLEIDTLPNSHAIAVPIIQVTAGIILGLDTIVLLTKEGTKVTKQIIPSVVQLENFRGFITLPSLLSGDNYLKTLKMEERQRILLAAHSLTESETKFVYDWPVPLQITIICILNFVKKVGTPPAVAVALSVLISCIHKFLFVEKSVSSVSTNWRSNHVDEINDLLHKTAGMKSKTRYFYKKFERCPDTKRDFIFRDTYDKKKVYDYTQYKSLLYHCTMLNKLLGNPFKPASATELHCHLIYNSIVKIVEQEYKFLDFVSRSFDGGFSLILEKFVTFICKENNIHLNGYFAPAKKQKAKAPPAKQQTIAKPSGQNRFAFLDDGDDS